MNPNPLDICNCGDYRKDHPNNGACEQFRYKVLKGGGLPGEKKNRKYRRIARRLRRKESQ